MSDRDTLPGTGGTGWESRLRSGLRDLEAGTPGGGGLPGADQARRTHARRRTALAVAAALATVAVAGGTVLALDRSGTSAPDAPATTGPAPTATAAPEPTTSAPSPSGTTETSAPPASIVPTTIPDGFLIPHEGETSDDADLTDWTSVGPLPMAPCDHATDPRVDGVEATDGRAVEQSGPEYHAVVQLQVFADAATAAGWLAAHQDIATACIGQPSTEGETTVVEDLPGSWGQGVVWVDGYRTVDGNEPGSFGPGGTYTLMVRIGSAVATVQQYGEYAPALEQADPDVVAGLRADLDELAPRLCVFTEAGC